MTCSPVWARWTSSSDYSRSVYENAVSTRNTAQSLADQAKVARDERDRLKQAAEEKMKAAQAAAQAAKAALDEQASNVETLKAQLAALKDTTTNTVVWGTRLVLLPERRKSRHDVNAKRPKPQLEAGAAAGSGGWVRPHGGARSSSYGPRTPDCGPQGCSSSYHYGADLANGCGAPSMPPTPARWTTPAATETTATTSGSSTAQASAPVMRTSWMAASSSTAVSRSARGRSSPTPATPDAPSDVALHFEVYIDGGYTNPIQFMEDRGVYV